MTTTIKTYYIHTEQNYGHYSRFVILCYANNRFYHFHQGPGTVMIGFYWFVKVLVCHLGGQTQIQTQTQTKLIQQIYIQIPYQVYTSSLEIQITNDWLFSLLSTQAWQFISIQTLQKGIGTVITIDIGAAIKIYIDKGKFNMWKKKARYNWFNCIVTSQ